MRKSPLTRYTELARTGPLPRVRTLAEVRASRPTISRDERDARAVVRARAAGLCEGCQRAPATDYAHRVGRAQGGPWCPANALHLCRPCHGWCHANPAEARTFGWLLRSTDNPLTSPALLYGRGWTYLTVDGLYVPAPTEGDAA